LFAFATLATAAISLQRVHLVEYFPETGNMLFRGNMPTNDTSFAWDDMLAFMRQRASEAGVPFPSEYFINDICLNNPVDMNQDEVDWWNDPSHSALGRMIWWTIGFAGLLPPSDYSPDEQKQMAMSEVWKQDQLPTRLPLLWANLTTKFSVPQIYYVHCTAGCDRTGEFIGSYRMQFHGANTTDMYARDTSECGRSPNYFATNALMWYCIRYEEVTGTNIGDCLSFAECEPFGGCVPTNRTEADTDTEPEWELVQRFPTNTVFSWPLCVRQLLHDLLLDYQMRYGALWLRAVHALPASTNRDNYLQALVFDVDRAQCSPSALSRLSSYLQSHERELLFAIIDASLS